VLNSSWQKLRLRLWPGQGKAAPGSRVSGGRTVPNQRPPRSHRGHVLHPMRPCCCVAAISPLVLLLPPSLCSVLFSPPSCCEAPHSFPHSHFHFPALGFASTLSSASFAQMTSNKTIRDAPIRLYSWCRSEGQRCFVPLNGLFQEYVTGLVTLGLHGEGFL